MVNILHIKLWHEELELAGVSRDYLCNTAETPNKNVENLLLCFCLVRKFPNYQFTIDGRFVKDSNIIFIDIFPLKKRQELQSPRYDSIIFNINRDKLLTLFTSLAITIKAI